ncbi:immunoglobulin superfamily member 1-like isoform X2 [Mauremys reevesii]|uniref:immunoglobulin superfamily member 1-like isoform X2 n=1 Tax=Mauremys reevesii TaxID=260615 RepID=UPI00193F85A0|nr:immunoglobulin superfamily member 1-like isoform X2 [Mauremys reevesii]
MASALTVLLLGCWLAGHSGVWGQPSYPKPTISGIPSDGVSLGGSVSIWCKRQHQDVQFMLYKDGRHIQSVDTNSQALFLINNVRREDGGNYSCSYRSKSEPFKMSEPSDPVELVVRDPSLPRPSISLSPTGVTAPGADVTIRCEGQRRDVRFFLHKAGDLNPQQQMDPAGNVSEFRIPSVGRQHGGSYSCSYRPSSEPFASSLPSDPVELVVRDPSLPRPSISLSPTGVTAPGADVTIRCEGQRRDVRFFLHKAGDLNPQQQMDTAGNVSEFLIPSVRRQHGGSYSCSYRPRSEPFVSSQPSDSVELVVRDPSLPRPSISLSPTGVPPTEADVTIRCQGQRRDVRFFLHKAGDLNAQRHMDTAGNVSEFRIPSVGRQDGGSYNCSYRPRSEPFISSLPSDPVELVVAEPTLPKPSISPSGNVSLGGSVSVRCQGLRPGVRFELNKGRRHVAHVDTERLAFVFPINNVQREQGGNYSCSHHHGSEPFTEWSDSVELVVAG